MATPRIQSVDRAFSLLASLARQGGGRSLPTMATECGLTVATAHRLLATLETLGAVVHVGPGEYRIGLQLVELVGNTSRDEVLAAAVDPMLRVIIRTMGHTAHVGVLDPDHMVTYIAKAARPAHRLPTRIGSQLEAYCSGLGKVLLAAMPEQAREKYLSDGAFVALTANTIVDAGQLRSELDVVRARGYAVDDCEIFHGLRCVAVPIFDRNGHVVAALSTSSPAVELKRADIPGLARQLQVMANGIRDKLYPTLPASSRPNH